MFVIGCGGDTNNALPTVPEGAKGGPAAENKNPENGKAGTSGPATPNAKVSDN
jgi:hypothetical protein